ncbi:MAG: proton-conducting transporter membrane subunit, partial [Chloroflexota bacterium]
ATGLWMAGSFIAQPGDMFVPIGMAVISLLTASLSVEPFLYAALLIEIAVLISVPLMAPLGQPAGRGVFRFLAFQTFGVLFILFTGWMLAGVEASPGDLQLVGLASALLGLGFVFLLGIFPFHTWIPMIAKESHPYISAFIFFVFPFVISLFALGFFDRYVWLRDAESVYVFIRTVGALMVFVGGLWALFESHLGKILGFAVLMETGLMLVTIGIGTAEGLNLYFMLILPRLISLLFWAIALSIISKLTANNYTLSAIHGFGKQHPIPIGLLIVSQLSLAGLPLLAGFPVKVSLWSELSSISFPITLLVLLGNVFFFGSSLKVLHHSISEDANSTDNRQSLLRLKTATIVSENPYILLFTLIFAVLIIIAIGLFPNSIQQALINLPLMFEHLGP